MFKNRKSKVNIGLVPKDEGGLSGGAEAELHSRAGLIPRRAGQQWTQWGRKKKVISKLGGKGREG